jgi:hypothetical protein
MVYTKTLQILINIIKDGIKMRKIYILSVVLSMFIFVNNNSSHGLQNANKKTALLMPEEYQYVYLGMSKNELRQKNKKLIWDISIHSYRDDYVDEKFYNYVNFKFNSENGAELIQASFGLRSEKKHNKLLLADFLTYCIEKWGEDYQVRLYTFKESDHYLEPLLYWSKADADIVIYFKSQFLMNFHAISIYNPKLAYQSIILKENTRLCTKKEIYEHVGKFLRK